MIDLSELDAVWFPRLDEMRVAEPGSIPNTHEWHWTERHLHCLWSDDKLRPEKLLTTKGEQVNVVDAGRWNLEAGPDFLNAVVIIGNRTLKGDIEIHIRPSDWNAHHHTNDPRYANVMLHVTWFPAQTNFLTPHIPSVALRDTVVSMHRFSFDSIDLSAYPHAILPSTPRPCGERLSEASPSEIRALLESAGMSRLRRKALRMALRLQVSGSRYQVFYEEFMAALGYKPNADGMRTVAELMPVEQLCESTDFMSRYATLLGIAGMLPQQTTKKNGRHADETRKLWDLAWKLGVADSPDRPLWNLGGTRPINHPRQRLATTAVLFDSPTALLDQLSAIPQNDGKAWVKAAAEAIQHPLEAGRASLGAPFKDYLKIGEQRINTILTNVVVPLLSAENRLAPNLYNAIPGEAANEQTTEAAFRLLGRDHNPAIYRSSGLRMQGLLEIWNGFCLSTKSQCADCPLAEAIRTSVKKGAE